MYYILVKFVYRLSLTWQKNWKTSERLSEKLRNLKLNLFKCLRKNEYKKRFLVSYWFIFGGFSSHFYVVLTLKFWHFVLNVSLRMSRRHLAWFHCFWLVLTQKSVKHFIDKNCTRDLWWSLNYQYYWNKKFDIGDFS